MTTQEIINGLQNVLDYCRYHQDAPALREAIEMLKCSEIPNSSDERTDKRTETHECDLIDRQEAIDELTEYGSGNDIYMSVGELKRRIEALPPAQPEVRTQMSSADCISRQAAIDEICLEWCNRKHDDCVHISDFNLGLYWCDGCSDVQTIMDLPLAQPEIIHCRECRNWINHCCYERKHIKTGFYTSGNKYCAWAERREG